LPDPKEVERGLQVFTAECAACHGLYDREARKVREIPESKYMQRVKPGTDPERSKAFFKPAADALNDFGERRHLWEKEAFRPVIEEGEYLCGPLDGIWARAPYLHNGSVPTLADLLKPPPKGALDRAQERELRPRSFYRGNRRYDEVNVGWVSTEPTEGARVLFEYRTIDASGQPIPGNSNAGHIYGTELSEQDKSALLSYLKTL
jgi:cytochrome c peroxidase